MEMNVEKNQGNENLKGTIIRTDYDKSEKHWRMWNISTLWVAR
jgi:hypothetical protein